MFAFTSLASCANAAALRAPHRSPSRAARARAVVADAVTTGRAVWLAEDGRKDAPAGAFTQDFLFDLGVPQFPTESFAPVNDIRFEAGSEAVAVTVERPLGIVFEERVDGVYTKIVVDEILPGSNAEKSGDVRVGDVLRITTAVFNVPGVVDVTAWLNPPKATNCKAFFVCEQKGFDKVMSAIQSRRRPGGHSGRPMESDGLGLVLERPANE